MTEKRLIIGRPAHEIWELFTVVVARSREDNKVHPDVKCVFCNTLLANAQPSRNMLRHALQCNELSDDAKVKWKDLERKQRQSIKEKLRTPQTRTPDKGNGSSLNKRLFGTPSSAVVPREIPRRQQKPTKEENYLRVATGFYATGIPFRCVEDPNFRTMFDFDLPSRHQLAARLLDSIYGREKAHVIEALTGATHLSIVTDRWSNINNESIINFVVTKPHIRPVFWKSISTHDAAHTSVFIARSISNAIDEIESVVGKGAVTSVVTDNTANMKGAWKILQRERQGIVCNGCAAHGMNLLMKDVLELEDFAAILQQAKMVSCFVKDHHAMWDRFKQLQKQMKREGESRRRLSLPVPTRWYSSEKCIKSLVANKDVIAAVFSDNELLDRYQQSSSKVEQVKELLRNESFWATADIALKLMHPINTCLAAFERDDCCVSMVYHQFEWLLPHPAYTQSAPQVDLNLQRMILELVGDRRQFLCNDAMAIAYFLDQTKSLSGFVEDDTVDFINCAVMMADRFGLLSNITGRDFHNQLVAFGLAKRSWTLTRN
ncbi:hypothetical protein FI667_g5274, partial [Globisporangium splendens]